MAEVVSIRFKDRGKTYYFDPSGITAEAGSRVVVETAKGLELGECVQGNHQVADERVVQPLRPLVRVATPDDLRVAEINKAREKDALDICRQKIEKHGLDMKLVDVDISFDGSKIVFFFASEGRVDFRELVKDLAGVFRTRIELRQIGVRDEAKMLGGIGMCGRPFCCQAFLTDFQPVSTKMAKTQSISLNPAKISGCCGRLMCCLRYEQAAYEDLIKAVPKAGAFVETISGYGVVDQVNLLRSQVRVRLDGPGEQVLKTFDADEVAAVPGGRPKEGEPLPKVLQYVPKPPKEEPKPVRGWDMPQMIAPENPSAERPAARTEEQDEAERKRRQRKRSGRGGQKPKGEKAPAQPQQPRQGPKPKQGPRPPQPQQPKGEKPAAAEGQAPNPNRKPRHRRYGKPKQGPQGGGEGPKQA